VEPGQKTSISTSRGGPGSRCVSRYPKSERQRALGQSWTVTPPTAAHIGPSRWTASSGGECARLPARVLAPALAGSAGRPARAGGPDGPAAGPGGAAGAPGGAACAAGGLPGSAGGPNGSASGPNGAASGPNGGMVSTEPGAPGPWPSWPAADSGSSRAGRPDIRRGIKALRSQVNGPARGFGAGAPGSARPGSFNGAGARDHP